MDPEPLPETERRITTICTQQKGPPAGTTAKAGGRSEPLHHREERRPAANEEILYFVAPDVAPKIFRFVNAWEGSAQRFLSAFYHDTYEGHRIAVDMGLAREHFPRAELWQCAEILGLCALADIQRPCITAIIGHADDIGIALCGDNDHDLDWLRNLEASAGGLEAYGRELRDFARRARIAGKLYRAYWRVLNG